MFVDVYTKREMFVDVYTKREMFVDVYTKREIFLQTNRAFTHADTRAWLIGQEQLCN